MQSLIINNLYFNYQQLPTKYQRRPDYYHEDRNIGRDAVPTAKLTFRIGNGQL